MSPFQPQKFEYYMQVVPSTGFACLYLKHVGKSPPEVESKILHSNEISA